MAARGRPARPGRPRAVCAVSRSTIRPSALRRGEVPALAVRGRTPHGLDRERRTALGEPAGHPGVGHGAEVVGVGDEDVAVAGVDQRVEQAGAAQRGVEVAVARGDTTPGRVGRVGHRRSGRRRRSLGSLFCRNSSGRPVDRQVLVARPAPPWCRREVRKQFMNSSGRGASYFLRRWSTCRAMMSRKVRPAAHAEQRLGAVHAHRGAEAAVELDHGRLPDRLGGDVVVHLDVGQRLHVERLDRVLGDHAGLAVLEEPVVVRERVDRDLVDPGLAASCRVRGRVRARCPCLPWFDRRLLRWPSRHWRGRARLPRPPCGTRCWRPAGAARSTAVGRSPRRLPASRWPGTPVRGAATVAAYVSVGSEPGTGLLLDALVAAGKRVLAAGGAARTSTWTGPSTRARSLAPARFAGSSSRPGRGSAWTRSRRPTWSLVPGLAVSPAGDRLGRGGGCYDRALTRVPAGTPSPVVLYDDEVGARRCPTDPHDVAVGFALTARRGRRPLSPGESPGTR